MAITINRTHSPDYPAIGLPEAIERARRLHGKIQNLPAPREIVVKGLGYSSLNGASMSSLASLRKFGLLERAKGGDMKLSSLALKILFPSSEKERASAVQEAAMKPQLFAELASHFGKGALDDDLLRNHLVRQGFLLSAIPQAANSFRQTMTLVPQDGGDYNLEDEVETEETGEMPPSSATIQGQELALRPTQPQTADTLELSGVRGMAAHASERRLFDYDLEAGGGVGVVIRGHVDTVEALEIVSTWVEVKRKEIERRAKASLIKAAEGLPAESDAD